MFVLQPSWQREAIDWAIIWKGGYTNVRNEFPRLIAESPYVACSYDRFDRWPISSVIVENNFLSLNINYSQYLSNTPSSSEDSSSPSFAFLSSPVVNTTQ